MSEANLFAPPAFVILTGVLSLLVQCAAHGKIGDYASIVSSLHTHAIIDDYKLYIKDIRCERSAIGQSNLLTDIFRHARLQLQTNAAAITQLEKVGLRTAPLALLLYAYSFCPFVLLDQPAPSVSEWRGNVERILLPLAHTRRTLLDSAAIRPQYDVVITRIGAAVGAQERIQQQQQQQPEQQQQWDLVLRQRAECAEVIYEGYLLLRYLETIPGLNTVVGASASVSAGGGLGGIGGGGGGLKEFASVKLGHESVEVIAKRAYDFFLLYVNGK